MSNDKESWNPIDEHNFRMTKTRNEESSNDIDTRNLLDEEESDSDKEAHGVKVATLEWFEKKECDKTYNR